MFEFEFMQNAFIAGSIISIVCGLISVFVVLRRASFATHALAHTSLTGSSGALLLGLSGITGQLFINIIAGLLMALLSDKIKKNDLIVGVLLTFFLGLGAYFLFLYQQNYSGGVMGVLFGNILAVSRSQVYILLGLSVIIFFTLFIFMRKLIINSIDPVISSSKNISSKLLNIIFFVLLAITVSMGCQVVGVLLIFSMLVVPGAIAAIWCGCMYTMMLVSVLVSFVSVIGALFITNYYDFPPGFCVTMILCGFYFIGFLVNLFKK